MPQRDRRQSLLRPSSNGGRQCATACMTREPDRSWKVADRSIGSPNQRATPNAGCFRRHFPAPSTPPAAPTTGLSRQTRSAPSATPAILADLPIAGLANSFARPSAGRMLPRAPCFAQPSESRPVRARNQQMDRTPIVLHRHHTLITRRVPEFQDEPARESSPRILEEVRAARCRARTGPVTVESPWPSPPNDDAHQSETAADTVTTPSALLRR